MLAHYCADKEFLWEVLCKLFHHEMRVVLDDLRSKVDFLCLYDLIVCILTCHDGWCKLLLWLGPEVEDGIDVLLL